MSYLLLYCWLKRETRVVLEEVSLSKLENRGVGAEGLESN